MYTLTFNSATILDINDYKNVGRQFFGAVVVPYSGVFTNKPTFYTEVPKILCPYQVNDIIIIQEQWAMNGTEYVYKIEEDYSSNPSGIYDFRPSYTMPDDAARFYGRIVSTSPWLITSDIADKYIPRGLNIDNCAGSAKVIGSTDVANKLLKDKRSQRNKEALGKTYQPRARTSDPAALKYVPYQMYPVDGSLGGQALELQFRDERTGNYIRLRPSFKTDSVQAYYSLYGTEGDPQALFSGEPVDPGKFASTNQYNLNAWATYPTPLTEAQAELIQETTGTRLLRRGRSATTPGIMPLDPNNTYVYLILDDKGNPIPIYAYYVTEDIDANQPVFAWLISGYLSDKEGNIIGNWW